MRTSRSLNPPLIGLAGAAVLAVTVAFPCGAAVARPADGGGVPAAAPAAPAPSEGWSDADRAPGAVDRGNAALAACASAHRSAERLSDRVTRTLSFPDGTRSEVIELEFGPKGSFGMSTERFRVACADGKLAFVPDQPSDRCLVIEVQGRGHDALVAAFGDSPVPLHHLPLREPLAGAAPVDAFAGCGLGKGAKVAGFRERGDRRDVLLVGDRAEAVVSIDAATALVRSVDALLTATTQEGDVAVRIAIAAAPVVGTGGPPITLGIGSRTAVGDMDSLVGPIDAPAPGAAVAVGAKAPLEPLESTDGREYDLGDHRGKVIVIDFWASWCGPCRRALPQLQRFADEVQGDRRVVVVAVDVWERCQPDAVAGTAHQAADALGLRLPVLLDRDASLISAYGFPAIPATVVIAPDGTLAASHMGLPEDLVAVLRADVAKALGTAK